eukprot:1407152-Alexandrium_andersonii.AAC.1
MFGARSKVYRCRVRDAYQGCVTQSPQCFSAEHVGGVGEPRLQPEGHRFRRPEGFSSAVRRTERAVCARVAAVFH